MGYRRYLALVAFCFFFTAIVNPSLWAGNRHTVTVTEVVDSDTLRVIYNGKEEKVRLDGIDTPECRFNPKAEADSRRRGKDLKTIILLEQQATTFVMSLVKPRDMVRLKFDVKHRDRYGRVLGHVYLSNGKMVNEEIVKAGYASLMTIPPNMRYEQKFLEAYREPRERRRGLWKE